MNKIIAYTWITLILIGFVTSDYVTDFFILSCLWAGILILGCSVMVKYGWRQNKYLTIYWCVTLILGTILSGLQFLSLDKGTPILPFNHISTIWMLILGINFAITSVVSRIVYFGPLGIVMLFGAIPLDLIKFSYPASIYGLIFSLTMIGYVLLSYLTPMDSFNLGKNYNENNGIDEEKLATLHKFKCSNCGYIYEGHEKLNYCPRCMAGSDLLVDVG